MFLFVLKLFRVILFTLLCLKRDLKALLTLSKINKITKKYADLNISEVFKQWLHKHPNKPCIVFNEKIWTFVELENYANQIANLFSERYNLKKGDSVALFMENKPEFIGIWYGLSKLGVVSALINTNLKSKPLVHSIDIAKPKVLIYGEELSQSVAQVKSEFNTQFQVVIQGEVSSSDKSTQHLETLLKDISNVFLEKEKVNGKDVLLYIYTSGTTGLPKPAIIKHNRFTVGAFSFYYSSGFNHNDVFLVTLPIYHSNAGVIGVGAALVNGSTIVLRKKFSASNFWKECIQYKVTGFSYVGEVCRYLVNQPPSSIDKAHSVRVCVGNGTRANIHKEFTERFGVKCVEVYGATEGNVVLINIPGKYGACGFIPVLNEMLHLLPNYVIKIDENNNPLRDKNGFCIPCEPNEKGLMVGEIRPNSMKQEFSGYANSDDSSNKKIIDNLFKKGQKAFNTGDMCMVDNFGWVYFIDRLGDTFRWRGENVSTVEVENIISSRLNNIEVIVYGVEIRDQEGRAGMCTIMSLDVDIKKLCQHIKADLAPYAKPLFIRLNDQVDHTGSLKAQKNRLVTEGFNINLFNDKTYYFDSKKQNYSILTKEIYDQIQSGQIRM